MKLSSVQSAAVALTFINKCTFYIDLFDRYIEVPIAPGETLHRFMNEGSHAIYRHNKDPQATSIYFRITSLPRAV